MRKRTHSHVLKHISYAPYTKKEYFGRKGSKSKIPKFTFGYTKPYQYELTLLCLKRGQLPEEVLESMRVSIGHRMTKAQKTNDFVAKIFVYPHIFVRKHGLLGVAKAERLMKGMRHSFGKITNQRVARLDSNQPILKLWVNDLEVGKKTLDVLSKKCPLPTKITFSDKPQNIPNIKEEKIIAKKEEQMVIDASKPLTDDVPKKKKQGKTSQPKVEKKGRTR